VHPKPDHLFKDSDDEAFWRSVNRPPRRYGQRLAGVFVP